MLFFSREFSPWNSTSGLRSQARKWLLVLTTFAFALSTVNWVLSVVVTFMALDSFGSAVTECFGSDTVSCLIPKVESIIQVASWEAISSNVNFINVSTVLCRVLAEYPHLIRKHSSRADPPSGTQSSSLSLTASSSGGVGSCVLTRVGLS
jgi:uncharacterized membrane protein YgcG